MERSPAAFHAAFRVGEWTVNPAVFAVGGTAGLVETSNGTLYFYYGEGV